MKHYRRLIQPSISIPPPPIVLQERGNQLSIDRTGHGLYVPDHPYRLDTPYCAYGSIITSPPQPPLIEPIRHDLLKIYFEFIDPVFPLFHTPSFQTQNKLLLYAIYAVSSRWDMVETHEPRGWTYYQQAVHLLDRQEPVELATVQAVLLLLKYNEHVRRPGYMWRTRYYFSMALRMCQDLGLSRDLNLAFIEKESRKRVFWAIYCYDLMMSIEQGTLPQLKETPIMIDLPIALTDEASTKIQQWTLLIQIIQHQAAILDYLRSKQENPQRHQQLSDQLTATMKQINPPPSPSEDLCYAVCFLHLSSHFAVILLHRAHLDICYNSAVIIKEMVEWILACHAYEDMYCSIRGVQQVIHYLSAAFTIFKEKGTEEEASFTFQLIQKLASISPVIEMSM
ncbi:hypothetical protein A0J61_04161 [Choanephora cucurbitarum]|uniref:Xylanolytic transcriptional activator regulatory domain-containing protein n=1 Tax=Choanephora cucurbitarum TaxID=101091 RepID=A0A1C7NFB2_9FUNG|nr:hypothetical protein A0J61_04161 [Choanephora cucurbitarum]